MAREYMRKPMKKTENIFQERKIAKIEKEETDCHQ
jgi:hypothetical protein